MTEDDARSFSSFLLAGRRALAPAHAACFARFGECSRIANTHLDRRRVHTIMKEAQDNDLYPARYWHELSDGRIQCDLCPRDCRLHEGQRGLCFVRQRSDNRMVLTT